MKPKCNNQFPKVKGAKSPSQSPSLQNAKNMVEEAPSTQYSLWLFPQEITLQRDKIKPVLE